MEPSQSWTWQSPGTIICTRYLPRHGNSLPHVARLIDEYAIESLDNRVLRAACEHGASKSELEFLLARTAPDWRKVVPSAARGGHVHVFRWMTERQDSRGPWKVSFSSAMTEAVRCGHLELVKWLHERGHSSNDKYALAEAIDHGHLAMVKWLQQEGAGLTDYEPDLKQATYNGHLATVQWIRMTFKDVDTSCAMAGAARKGDLDLLQGLHHQKSCSETCWTDAMDEAVRGGHFHVVCWLFENCPIGCSTDAAREAATAGNLPLLEWLHTHYSDRFASGVMDIAAKEGHLEIVKWLHEHRSEGCTSDAMGVAAYKGHLDVVRWLHDNRTEGWTTAVMDGAAEGGHLDIVTWLHENRSEGCSDRALHEAVRCGHVGVLRWLVEHYPDRCRDNLMEYAVFEGQLDAAQYLDENTNQRASACGVGAATKLGWMEAIQALVPFYPRGSYDAPDRHAVGRAFRNMLSRLSDQHVTPASLLWTELLESLEFFHSHGYNWCVCRMLQITLERGDVALVEQFMGHRDAGEKRRYVVAAATYSEIVLLRWLFENGSPIKEHLAFGFETDRLCIL